MSATHYIFGLHAIRSVLTFQRERVLQLYIQKDKRFSDAEKQLFHSSGIFCEYTDKTRLNKLAQSEHHQGIIAACRPPRAYQENDLLTLRESLQNPFFLILDGVEDPHNLGAVLRTADAVGVDAVITPKHHAVGLTPTVCKVASGAAETVKLVVVTNLARIMRDLKDSGVWIFGLAGEATQTIFESSLTMPLALALGAEGDGLRRLTRESCDELIKIPMAGSVESLNVSVAAGVALYEAKRQRG